VNDPVLSMAWHGEDAAAGKHALRVKHLQGPLSVTDPDGAIESSGCVLNCRWLMADGSIVRASGLSRRGALRLGSWDGRRRLRSDTPTVLGAGLRR
jgi:hypothetical protein